jgi:chromosomal replication initiation ATPase DnaA
VLDGRFRFDNFVVGASNRLAVAAARAVADAPGAVYNPLVIHGAKGLGKTHLVAALGRAVSEKHPGLRVEYVTLEDFVSQLHAAVAAGRSDEFAQRYLAVNVLLLEDIQALSGQADTQTGVVRLLNILQGGGQQIVLTCDRPLSDVVDLDERLLGRIGGGLIVDLGAPDFETRAAIVRRKCAEQELALDPVVVDQLASAPLGSVRDLEGALHVTLSQSVNGARTSDHDRPPIVSPLWSAAALPGEYESFLSDVSLVVSRSVADWRARLRDAIGRWSAEGFRTAMLERALEGSDTPDVPALESTFAAAASRLRALEQEAARLDRKLAGLAVFRDPERITAAEAILQRALAAYDPPPAPNPRLTISTFIPGERNQLALRGAGEVIAVPGVRYNPLYLYGASRSGKTHLLHAIGNSLATRDDGGWTVACLTGAWFAEDLDAALHDGTIDRWRMRYRSMDAVLIDDVQSLAGQESAQAELLLLLESLHDAGKQVVLAANAAPTHLGAIDERLRSRFEQGLIVEIGRVPEGERVARHTPVPVGAEAAAPTIDAWFDEIVDDGPTGFITDAESLGEDTDSFFLDPEKSVVEWPAIDGRIIEELR